MFFKKIIQTILILAIVFFPLAASASIGVAPAHPVPNEPLTQSWFVYHLKPGESKDDGILINNHSEELIKVNVYPIEAEINNQGSFVPRDDKKVEQGVSQWTKLKFNEITLGPGEGKEVPLTVTVPSNIKPGQYVGAVIAESSAIPGEVKEGQNFNIKTRAGVRMYVTVGESQAKQSINKSLHSLIIPFILLILAVASLIIYIFILRKSEKNRSHRINFK